MIFYDKEDAIMKLEQALKQEAKNTKPSLDRLAKHIGFYDMKSLQRAMQRFDLSIELHTPPEYFVNEGGE